MDKDSIKELKKFDDEAGVSCSVHDTQKRSWRHLNFFEHSCHLHCVVPRIRTSDGKVRLVQLPWARSGSGFTLLFEALAMDLEERRLLHIVKGKDSNTIKEIGDYLAMVP